MQGLLNVLMNMRLKGIRTYFQQILWEMRILCIWRNHYERVGNT